MNRIVGWNLISFGFVFRVKHLESKCLDSRNKTVAGLPLYEPRMICFPPGGRPNIIVGKTLYWVQKTQILK